MASLQVVGCPLAPSLPQVNISAGTIDILTYISRMLLEKIAKQLLFISRIPKMRARSVVF